MRASIRGWWGWVVLAGAALWLLLSGPDWVLGWHAGQFGIALLIGSVWGLLHMVSRMPREAVAGAASPAEWKARIGAGFTLMAMVYFLAKLHVLNDAPLPDNPGATVVGRNLVLLLVAWTILANVLASRWAGAVEQDERDREIAARAVAWGRGALVTAIIAIAVMLSITPAARLAWATPLMIGHVLILALMWGGLCEYVATCACYLRDRREDRA